VSREVLDYGLLKNIVDFAPIPVGFIGWLWKKLKWERHLQDGTPMEDLEIDHDPPLYRGGSDKTSNLTAYTRPEHALKHLRAARDKNLSPKDRQKEGYAVQTIKSRMRPDELKLYEQYKQNLGDKT